MGQQFALVGLLLLPIVLAGTFMLARRGYRDRCPVAILLSTSVIVPLAFFAWHGLSSRVGDSWPLFVWPIAFACAAINLKRWTGEAPGSRMAGLAPPLVAFAIVSGIAAVTAAQLYYIAGTANYLKSADPIGKEAGFGEVVAAAERRRQALGASWFATTDYRIYSMLRWHLRESVPVVEINERARFIGFRQPELAGPLGLYVAPKNAPEATDWKTTDAVLRPLGETDLVWRGVVYDTYEFQAVSGWRPSLAHLPGDPLFTAHPH